MKKLLLTSLVAGLAMLAGCNSNNIKFADERVKQICVSAWDTDGNGKLSYEEAAAVTSVDGRFRSTNITSFDEFQYFTGVTIIYREAFNNCLKLTSITLPEGIEEIGPGAFGGCAELEHIDIPDGVVALSLTIDTENNRLLLPNRGKDMNVLIYTNIYKRPTLSSTFGSKGGIFAQNDQFKAGQVGEYRFSGPTAAGVDTNGNIYVANTAVSNGRGAVVEAYNEKTKRRLWKSEGLIFTATADFDRTQPNIFYSPEKIHRIDFSREGGRIDELVAYTADPFRYPDDERVKKNGAFVTSSFKRTIGGKSFLFISDMYGGMLAGYRFDEKTNGYIGIPFLFANNGDPDKNRKITFWVDKDGDAKRQDEEYIPTTEINQYSMSLFVDHTGNIWRGTRHQGFFLWRVKGLNSLGIPQYAEPEFYPLPEGFGDAKRIYYDPVKDELYLGGFSPAYPDGQDTWWALGSTIVRCSNFMTKVARGEVKKGWKPDMILYVPFNIEDGSGKDYHNAKAFTVEGDYIFVALGRYGWIMVYDSQTGKLIGRIEPDENINFQSGWCDFNYAINAMKQADGSYLILHEENGFGKILCYRWNPNGK
ncbi:MAG: leucine-rich repeat domain-containing protein [Alistipes sp.]|nr:leucine-rich repeat domain-containing protein [Alistipes sp.]